MNLKNRSVITTNVFIQDNGPEIQLYLKSVTAINSTTGEFKCFDCQYQDSLPEGWTEVQDINGSKVHPERPEYFQKQPHYAFLVDDLSLPVEYQDQVKAKILYKFPGMNVQKLVVVKSTEGSELLKLNSLIRVTGILEFPVITEWDPELDPLYYLPTIHIQDSKEITLTQMLSQYDHKADVEAVATKLQASSIISKFDRAGLTKVLKNAVGGDLLAAEYLVCQLFHSTSKRMGGVPTSKFNLNLYGKHLNPSKISEVISQVWPLVSALEFSIKALNEIEMQSCQTETGLKMGQLQKPNHSVFIIDETIMSEGVLNSTGIDNVKAVQHCIDYQSVEYKIPYGQFETESNFNFLMIGREPSLLQGNFKLPMTEEAMELYNFSDVNLKGAKMFIALQRESFYTISEEMQKNIENDFITMQKVAREKGQASDDGSELLNLLILAESMCKSYGKRQLEQDIWDKVKRMEQERLGRIANALKK